MNPNNYTTRQKIAQCVFPRLDIDKYLENIEYKNIIQSLVRASIGGFCVFSGTIKTAPRVIEELQALSEIPLLFSADFENGTAMRLDGGTAFPHAMALGKSNEPLNTHIIADTISKEAKAAGVFWNLAPVSDINSNPDNPIINIRSFGDTEPVVSTNVAEYINATQKNKVMACAKHFPGHGDTNKDSHLELPVLEKSLADIEKNEMIPFVKAISEGVRSIMVGHLSVPAIDKSGLPATLSAPIISGYLREKLGFEGIIVTDAMDMKAITDNFGAVDACVLSVKAGSNVVLMPQNPGSLIEEIEKIVKTDKALLDKFTESSYKIFQEKKWCGLIPVIPEISYHNISFDENEKLAFMTALKCTQLECNNDLIPINEETQFAGFAFLQTDKDFKSASVFFTLLSQAIENDCDFGYLDENIQENDLISLKHGIKNAKFLLFAYFYKSVAYHGSSKLPKRIIEIVNNLADGRPIISVVFGSPYIINELKSGAIIKTFSDSTASIASAVARLSGKNIPGTEAN